MNITKNITFICCAIFSIFIIAFYCFNILFVNILIAKDANNIESKNINYAKYRNLYAKDIKDWIKPHIDKGIDYKEMSPLPAKAPDNINNPYTKDKSILGKVLFNERMLSKSEQISCASCHNSELAFGDSLSTSFGHNRARGKRNAPNIEMSGFFDLLFWDGRASGLEEQALFPIIDPIEMANSLENMIESLQNMPQYYPLFILAFGDDSNKMKSINLFPNLFNTDSIESKQENIDEILNTARQKFIAREIDSKLLESFIPQNQLPQDYIQYAKSLITIENVGNAIAVYERTLVPSTTRFNQFLKGNYNALSDKEIFGLHIFRTKGRCMNCHHGVALSDSKFHNIGLSFFGRKLQDLGRYEITKDKKDLGAFKTPSLIHVSKSAPYMHNGILPSLAGVLNMYNAGFPTTLPKASKDNPLAPTTTPLIKPLNLTRDELDALLAFLQTL